MAKFLCKRLEIGGDIHSRQRLTVYDPTTSDGTDAYQLVRSSVEELFRGYPIVREDHTSPPSWADYKTYFCVAENHTDDGQVKAVLTSRLESNGAERPPSRILDFIVETSMPEMQGRFFGLKVALKHGLEGISQEPYQRIAHGYGRLFEVRP